MIEHRFGGNWTQDKLGSLKSYLIQYRLIFASNARAKFFTTWYVDAFAGTGTISTAPRTEALNGFLEETAPEEQSQFLEGSAKIALGLQSPFHKYLFIDKSKKRTAALQGMVTDEFPALADRVIVQVQHANEALQKWCRSRDWSKERAVVFLDPYGMQVQWSTVELLASTKGVDLWYLFPFATRLLRNDQQIDEAWARRLDLLFGTEEWRSRFYPVRQMQGLFGPFETKERDATESNIQAFIEERLQTCFMSVARSRLLRNGAGSPLYALCFAASNPIGAKTAIKIAQHLLKT